MARKTIEVRIPAEEGNRDSNKLFTVTEMPAYAAERWAADAFQGLVSAGVDVPEDLASAGVVAIAKMGLKALGGMKPETMHDLFDRMLPCITFYPDPAHREINRPVTCQPPWENDVEEIGTLLMLRRTVLELHGSFLVAGAKSLAGRGISAQN